MDPDVALDNIRSLMGLLKSGGDLSVRGQLDLLEYWEALDEWMTKGGFPPNAWVWTER